MGHSAIHYTFRHDRSNEKGTAIVQGIGWEDVPLQTAVMFTGRYKRELRRRKLEIQKIRKRKGKVAQ